jgi:hypothetical protein
MCSELELLIKPKDFSFLRILGQSPERLFYARLTLRFLFEQLRAAKKGVHCFLSAATSFVTVLSVDIM